MDERASKIGGKESLNSSMTPEEFHGELDFYQKAYGSDTEYSARNRIERGFGWGEKISPTVVELIDSLGLAENTTSKSFLDLGCGDGRSSEYFYKLGFSVTGVDFSPEALAIYQAKFAQDPKVRSARTDLTAIDSLRDLGQFDLILDWSVLDHIRPAYVPVFISNILGALKEGGHIIASEFDTLPDLEAEKDSKIIKGHYSKIYKIDELAALFHPLQLIDKREHTLEDTRNNIYFNTVVFKK